MVAPEAACANLQRLAADGLAGRYGFYEAIDYTPARLPRGQTSAVVRSFMAHHQGMSLLSLAHLLLDRPMQRRFESDPLFQATLLLLQERVPKAARALPAPRRALRRSRATAERPEAPVRVFATPDTPMPGGAAAVERPLPRDGHQRRRRLQPLERPRGHALARGRAPATTGARSATCATSRAASSGRPRTSRRCKRADALRGDLLRGARRVPPPRRRLRDAHRDRRLARGRHRAAARAHHQPLARRARTIEVTSYAEVVLAPPAADALHPAFSNLFVQTEIVARAAGDPVHAPAALARRAAAVDVPPDGGARRRVGATSRTRPTAGVHRPRPHASPRPQAMQRAGPLSDSAGLGARSDRRDPPPHHARAASRPATIDMVTGMAETREAALAPGREVPGPPPRRPRVRAGVDAQPGDAAPDQRHRGRRAALRAPRQLDPLRQRGAARRSRRAAAATAAGSRGCGATPSPATCRSCCCRSATPRTSTSCASWCRRTRTGG